MRTYARMHPRIHTRQANLLHQQDPALANDEEDFKLPPMLDVEQLRQMIANGQLAQTFRVVFEGPRIGMMLADAPEDVR